MTKKKEEQIDHTTGYKGILIINPEEKKKCYFIYCRYGKDPITGKSIVIHKKRDTDGSRIYSINRAVEYLNELKSEIDKSMKLNFKDRMTYADFMNNHYIPSYKMKVQENTFSTRVQNLELMRNRYGHLALNEFTVQHALDFKSYLINEKKKRKNGKAVNTYSQATASLMFGMFRNTLNTAVRLGYLDINELMREEAIPKGRASVAIWTKNDFEKVINQVYIANYYQHLHLVMLWVYFTTGIRVNEGCALYWEDIDFEKKTMSINHMLIMKNKNDFYRKDGTKTKNGIRTLSLDDDTIEILKQWKKRQNEKCESQFVFSRDGQPTASGTIGKIIKRYAKLANVPEIQTKGLRHSHASYVINEFNIDILMLSERLGHSGPEITLRHYAKYYKSRDKEVANHITGNIKLETSNKDNLNFQGNGAINKDML